MPFGQREQRLFFLQKRSIGQSQFHCLYQIQSVQSLQGISAYAPHPNAAKLWQEFLYSDTGQLLWLKGFSHPARFADMSRRKVIPARLLKALPAPAAYAKVRFASPTHQDRAKARIAKEWPKKVGA